MSAGVQQIAIYYSIDLLEFLAATELMGTVRQSLRGYVRPVIFVFLLGFIYMFAQQVIHILVLSI
jgi:hypothetical protein